MIIVSNTSPITNLAAVSQLDLLQQLYNSIIIPQNVNIELTGVGVPVPGSTEVQTESWIETQQVSDRKLVTLLRQELDPGEAEAIALAIELNADLLLLDERRGDQVASSLAIKIKSLLVVLIAAKSRGLISAVKPVLDELIETAGFWITEPLYNRVLQLAGE